MRSLIRARRCAACRRWSGTFTGRLITLENSRWADEPVSSEPIDFSQFEPGETDLTILEQRFQEVESKVQTLIQLPKLRQMQQAHEALEAAKADQDATAVGRILTWAEANLR